MSDELRSVLVLVCRGAECGDARGSAGVRARFAEELTRQVLPGSGVRVKLAWQSCFGQCQKGVNVLVREMKPGEDDFLLSFVPSAGEEAVLYHGVVPSDASRIVAEHVIAGRIVQRP